VDRPALEVADIFRRYGETYRVQASPALTSQQRRVMTAIERCRTAALGGHVEQCDHCGHTRVWFNSCRDRHCPRCQSLARAAWIKARDADLLQTEYFHVVFTVPEQVAAIAYQNRAVVFSILFRAAAETLHTIAADPQHLGAQIGFFAVLHTWGQTLVFHPHLHCVVPGGGLSRDGSQWIACRRGFFLPVRVLSRLFRRLFLGYLRDAFDTGQLRFSGALQPLSQPCGFTDHLQPTQQTEWVVYAKPPFAGPQQVLDYVGRYTHRIAISNHRLLDFDGEHITFRYKDYAHGGKQRIMTLHATEFLRRFFLHVLPRGFVRIRHFGLLANRFRNQMLPLARTLLARNSHQPLLQPAPIPSTEPAPLWHCPRCGGPMRVARRLTATELYLQNLDSS
jgi:hypothetical protein